MLTPFGAPLYFGLTFFKAAADAQASWYSACFAAADKVSRINETPSDAATRAMAPRHKAPSGSWYRAPAAPWNEVADGLAGARAVTAFWQSTVSPAASFGIGPLTAPAMGVQSGGFPSWPFHQLFPSPFATTVGSPFAGTLGWPGLIPSPLMLNPLATPAAIMAASAIPSLLAQAMAAMSQLPSGTETLRSAVPARADVAVAAKRAEITVSAPKPVSAPPTQLSEAVGRQAGAHTYPHEAVASITLPDQTVFKISIPIAQPVACWPWAGGFGAGGFAAQNQTIEDAVQPADTPPDASPNLRVAGRSKPTDAA